MNRRFNSQSIFRTLAILVGVIISCSQAGASWEEHFQTVHFNPRCSDYGTPIRATGHDFRDAELWSVRYDYHHGQPVRENTDHQYAANNSAEREDTYDRATQAYSHEKLDGLWDRAQGLAQLGRWREARQILEGVVKNTHLWTADLRDGIGLLRLLEEPARRTPDALSAAKTYLTAISAKKHGNILRCVELLEQTAKSKGGGFLKDRIAFHLACIRYIDNTDRSAVLFQHFLEEYPASPLREDALIMIARCCVLRDSPDAQAQNRGRKALDQLMQLFPHSRFQKSVLGLRARLHFLNGRRRDAIWCYYQVGDLDSVRIVCESLPAREAEPLFLHLLEAHLMRVTDTADVTDERDISQINRLRSRLSVPSIRDFHRDLTLNPQLLASYIYYRMYYTNARVQDLSALVDMANQLLKSVRMPRIDPNMLVRISEVEYQRAHYSIARDWANRAIKGNSRCERAYFMRGSAEDKLHRSTEAQRDLFKVLELSRDHALRQSARELLALSCERSGKMATALDQYFELGYDMDRNYLLDVRMSTTQIEEYARQCKDALVYTRSFNEDPSKRQMPQKYTRKQLLTYSLGIRYLRTEMWADARRCLRALPNRLRYAFDEGRRTLGSTPSPDSLTAVNDLERLQAAIKQSKSYQARAAAAYRYASYYHTHGALLLYNPMLWQGERIFAYEIIWNEAIVTPSDRADLRRYVELHEPFLRSQALCLDVAKRYPNSRVAPRALFRAACASYRASALTRWYERSNPGVVLVPTGEATALMKRIVSIYPKCTLVSDASKYAEVFAVESRRSDWPRYASAQNAARMP